MLAWLLSNRFILCLDLNVWNQEINTGLCTATLSSNGRILAHFDNIHLKVLANAHFKVHFHSMFSKHENSKNRFFYDVITNDTIVSELLWVLWLNPRP